MKSIYYYFCGWVGGWVGGWLENWRVIPISAFNYVIVEVVAEIGKNWWKKHYSKIMSSWDLHP